MEKIVLIDGHSILFRAFYGMPLTMTAPDGTHTNAVYGFLSILRKVLADEAPAQDVRGLQGHQAGGSRGVP